MKSLLFFLVGLVLTAPALAQTGTLEGTIRDAGRDPLPSATIQVDVIPLDAPTDTVASEPSERPALAINDGRWAAAWRDGRVLRFRSGLINPSRPNPEQP